MMGWPQITMIVLLALGIGVSAAKHGDPRPPYSIGVALISSAITVWLLIAGGFFTTH
ncbi:hypothetical protein ACFOLL_12770 [Falsochrobactrum ovis]|uniref:Uncharacterized protein n=1 Tax=Falsochrobactrum ovis TaxID=1293442 RepID=A0A364JT61_9HYPH|nr:hypothetical protein [Falsochrobactrum ovis]RAK26341.1 hypothetical protein C7374_11426 [Falsochrobactrum ovis]